jgi:transketolase
VAVVTGKTFGDLDLIAKTIRKHIVIQTTKAASGHPTSSLSGVELLVGLYFGGNLNFDPHQPHDPHRDRFIMSKGHAAAITYAALAAVGFLSRKQLEDYGLNGGNLFGHVTQAGVPGIELSTGSLGHGLPVGTGMALYGKRNDRRWRVFVQMSDGELDEGSNWETILFAGHHGLDNLVAVVDYNGIQSLDRVDKTLRLEPLAAKFAAFGWAVVDLDGHDLGALRSAFAQIPRETGRPTIVIARTIKGKGVSFMENKVLWHYRSPAGEELDRALEEVSGAR